MEDQRERGGIRARAVSWEVMDMGGSVGVERDVSGVAIGLV